MMAGNAGGGWVAGSAVVEIRGDLTPLEADLARVPSMLAAAAQGGAIPIGGGMAGGGGGFTAAPPMPVGGASLGGAGLPAAGSPIVAYGGAGGLPMAPSPFAVNDMGAAAPSAAGHSSTGFSMRDYRRAMIFGSIASMGANVAESAVQGIDEYDHPEVFTRKYDRLGSAFNPFGNASIVQNSFERSRLQAINRIEEGLGSLPFGLGSFAKLADSFASADREREIEHLNRQDAISQYLPTRQFEVASAGARAVGDLVGAATIGAVRSRQAAGLDINRVFAEFGRFSGPGQIARDLFAATVAEGQYSIQQAQVEVQMAHEGYATRGAVADLQAAYRPVSAQATAQVERARQEVAAASPEMRADVIRANQHELEAAKSLATSQRGGSVAVDMNTYQAAGLLAAQGIDLTGADQDRRSAAGYMKKNPKTGENEWVPGIYDKGGEGLSSVPHVDDKIVAKLNELIKKLGTPVGVTMFTH